MRVFICVNTLDRVSSFIYANHIAFAAYNAKKFPDIQFYWYSPHRQTIDTSRNIAAIDALKLECDYLMFIDDDVLIPDNAFELLYNANKDIIAGLVYLRGYPFHVMAFKELPPDTYKGPNGDDIPDPRLKLTYYDEIHEMTQKGETLISCAAVGFSCCLIKTDIIQALEPPYFTTGPLNTEDVYFCLKTRKLTPEPEIYVHTGVKPGHLLNPEPIEYPTRELLTEFYNKLADKFAKEVGVPADNPHTESYIQRNILKLGGSRED